MTDTHRIRLFTPLLPVCILGPLRNTSLGDWGGLRMRLSKPAGITALAMGIASVTLVGGAGSAGAADQLQIKKTISSAFVGPLQFAVDGKRIFVADSFTSQLFRVGRAAPIATGPDPSAGGDLAG